MLLTFLLSFFVDSLSNPIFIVTICVPIRSVKMIWVDYHVFMWIVSKVDGVKNEERTRNAFPNFLGNAFLVLIYSFIPYSCFKQFSSIRKSSKPMVRMPFSSLHGLMSSFTTMTFLKVSLILRREAVSCFLFSSSGKASADCI